MYTMQMMDELGITIKQEIETGHKDRIEKKIKEAGPNGIKHMNLSNSFPYIHARPLKDHLETLLGQGRITMDVVRTTKRPYKRYIHAIFIR